MDREFTGWIIKQIMYGLISIACLLIITNQAMSYYYKNELLATPCELCAKLNPDVLECWLPKKTFLDNKTNFPQQLKDIENIGKLIILDNITNK